MNPASRHTGGTSLPGDRSSAVPQIDPGNRHPSAAPLCAWVRAACPGWRPQQHHGGGGPGRSHVSPNQGTMLRRHGPLTVSCGGPRHSARGFPSGTLSPGEGVRPCGEHPRPRSLLWSVVSHRLSITAGPWAWRGGRWPSSKVSPGGAPPAGRQSEHQGGAGAWGGGAGHTPL